MVVLSQVGCGWHLAAVIVTMVLGWECAWLWVGLSVGRLLLWVHDSAAQDS